MIFGCDEQLRHGNFHPASYAAICANPNWRRRLDKTHTAHRKLRARADWKWKELDCANSSDALLMNIFCHPQVATAENVSAPIARLLGIDVKVAPVFGVHPGVPLHGGLLDRTEIDLQLDTLLVEAKLTETSFQTAKPRLITRYRDLEEVFDVSRLFRTDKSSLRPELSETANSANAAVPGYQLIRNVLAAYASNSSFCVLCDGRRCDLIETWYAVLSTVHRPTFATRLKLLTWQELATALSADLRNFLKTKYGITAGA